MSPRTRGKSLAIDVVELSVVLMTALIRQYDRTQPPLLACLNPTGRKVTIQNLDNCVVVRN